MLEEREASKRLEADKKNLASPPYWWHCCWRGCCWCACSIVFCFFCGCCCYESCLWATRLTSCLQSRTIARLRGKLEEAQSELTNARAEVRTDAALSIPWGPVSGLFKAFSTTYDMSRPQHFMHQHQRHGAPAPYIQAGRTGFAVWCAACVSGGAD